MSAYLETAFSMECDAPKCGMGFDELDVFEEEGCELAKKKGWRFSLKLSEEQGCDCWVCPEHAQEYGDED